MNFTTYWQIQGVEVTAAEFEAYRLSLIDKMIDFRYTVDMRFSQNCSHTSIDHD